MTVNPPVVSEAPLSIPELVPYYMMPPCPFTKAQAVHYIVQDRLRGGVARGKGSNARKRAQKAQSEALRRKREARGWLTWRESLLKMKLERQGQLDGEEIYCRALESALPGGSSGVNEQTKVPSAV